jgi:carbonic anhydrase
MFIVSCNKDEDEPETCLEHFNYDATSEEGPTHWDQYCVDAGTANECGSTVRQSPINVVNEVIDGTLGALNTNYSNSTTDILNNGHTIQFNYNGTATFNIDGTDFSLLQFHFHTGSEHTVAGTQYPMEVHLVHASSDGALAVIGVFFEIGTENVFLAQFIDDLPHSEDGTFTDALSYNASSLFPTGNNYFNYEGSLTTPPCSEVVKWFVMEENLTISQAQLDEFEGLLHNNFRPIQGLNGRTIKKFVQ